MDGVCNAKTELRRVTGRAMGNKTGFMSYRAGLALAGGLAGWLAGATAVLAQGSGGLVISSLPSDLVIGSAPTAWAKSATAWISITSSVGFETDSKNTALVPGRIAAFH